MPEYSDSRCVSPSESTDSASAIRSFVRTFAGGWRATYISLPAWDLFRQPVVLNLGPFSQAGEGFVMAYRQADAARLVPENGRVGFRAVELFERLVVDQILQPVFRMLQRLPLIGDAVCRDTVRIRQFAVFYGNPLQFLVFFLRPVCIVRLPSVRGFGFSRSMCACSCCLS